MNPAASLDLFVLTFNCAKNIIDVDVFARHLQHALQQHGQRREGDGPLELPDLVVFSLQEISPLAQSFVGGYLLNPYLLPFKDALNLAASGVEEQQQQQQQQQQPAKGTTSRRSSRPQQSLQRSTSTLSTLWRRSQQDYPYKLVGSRNVGMTAIMLFARKPDAIHHIQVAECAFGIADMGNKGAVALRVTYSGAGSPGEGQDEAATDSAAAEQRTTEITFVATHLAAMEYNLRRRNANWASIVSSCTFENPKEIVSSEFHIAEPGTKNVIDASTKSNGGKQTDGGQDIPPPTEDERAHLLKRRQTFKSMPKDEARRLHDASIFKPGSHFFVAGDLNYRVSTKSPPTLAPFPTLDNYMSFFENDQLTEERRENRTLHGLSEADVNFPPTYKIKHLNPNKFAEAVNKDEIQAGGEDVVPWKWAPHRWPGWCDRILYLDIPPWVKRRHGDKAAAEIVVHKYNSMPTMLSSDHQPVFLRVSVPLLTPEELSPGTEDREGTEGTEDTESAEASGTDPRVHLPIPIDLAAWERRASARKKELTTGMMTLFFSTREGAVVLGTVAIVSLMTWWLYRGGL